MARDLDVDVDPLSRALLARVGARRTAPHTDAALRALAESHGYTLHPCVLDFEQAYGGLEIPEWPVGDDEDLDDVDTWLIGTGACLASDGHAAPRGGDEQAALGLVPIAYSATDIICYLDADGMVWGHDTIEFADASRWAADGAAFIAGTLLWNLFWSAPDDAKVELPGRQGLAVATALGVAALTAASDADLELWWGDANGEVVVLEPHRDGDELTWVVGVDPAALRAFGA